MTIRQINQTLDEGLSLKLITQAYSEVAAIKLRRIRAGIERNRNFFNEISQVFHTIKVLAAQKKNLSEVIDKLLIKNGKTISILLTSNYRFYGDINNTLIRHFIVSSAKINTERVVVGRTGIEFLQAIRYTHSYLPLIFKTDMPEDQELQNLADKITQYKQVLVYHSSFKSVLLQLSTTTDVTQSVSISPTQPVAEGLVDFILEPEIDKMLAFFDSQVTTLILEQTFLESELSRTAARLISMDNAESNANQFIQQQKRALATAKKSLQNVKLLETFASFMSWRQKMASL